MIDLIEWINEKLPDLPGSLGALVYSPNDSGFVAELLTRLEHDFSIKLERVRNAAEWLALELPPPLLLPVWTTDFFGCDDCRGVLKVAMKTQPWILPVRYKLPSQPYVGSTDPFVWEVVNRGNRVPANEDFSYAVAAHMELLAAAIRRLASTSRDKNALTLARIPKYNSMIRKLVQIPHLNGSFDISQHGVKLAEQVSAVTAFWPEALWYYVHLWCGKNGL